MAGALIGGATEEIASALARFGLELGLAFQIRDDILGLWGDSRVTGKAPGEDILQKKKSLPLVYALNQPAVQASELRAIYSEERIAVEAVPRAMAVLETLGAQEWAQAQALEHYRRGLAALEEAGLSPEGHHQLKSVATFLVEREN